jgi:hypothetical protein
MVCHCAGVSCEFRLVLRGLLCLLSLLLLRSAASLLCDFNALLPFMWIFWCRLNMSRRLLKLLLQPSMEHT